jgi:hypothetical protein
VLRRVETPKTAKIAIEFTSYDVVLNNQDQAGQKSGIRRFRANNIQTFRPTSNRKPHPNIP